MASDQYQFPQSTRIPTYEAVDTQLVEAINAAFDPIDVKEMNERFPIDVYNEVKKDEADIEDFRKGATEANLPKISRVQQAREAVKNLLERL